MLSRWQSTIVDEQGNVQPLANLTVRLESDQSLAKMWASPGTTQPLPDGMVQADGNGYAYFYAEGGLYRITSATLGIDWRHVPLGELAHMDVADLGLGTAATRDVGTGPDEISVNADLQWLGTPVGGYITPFEEPPTDDPRFRYILCTAGESGSGGYNEGVLTDETVTGSYPTNTAIATVSLAGSPMNGETVPLINTEGRFVGAGTVESVEDDMLQGHHHPLYGGAAGTNPFSGRANLQGVTGSVTDVPTTNGASAINIAGTMVSDGGNGAPRGGDRTQPRTHRLPHYRRIL